MIIMLIQIFLMLHIQKQKNKFKKEYIIADCQNKNTVNCCHENTPSHLHELKQTVSFLKHGKLGHCKLFVSFNSPVCKSFKIEGR